MAVKPLALAGILAEILMPARILTGIPILDAILTGTAMLAAIPAPGEIDISDGT